MDLIAKLSSLQEQIRKMGSAFYLYNDNLNFLLSSKTKEEFIKKYKRQLDSGYNTIEIYEELASFNLEELKNMAINTVIEYAEAEIEYLEENDGN